AHPRRHRAAGCPHGDRPHLSSSTTVPRPHLSSRARQRPWLLLQPSAACDAAHRSAAAADDVSAAAPCQWRLPAFGILSSHTYVHPVAPPNLPIRSVQISPIRTPTPVGRACSTRRRGSIRRPRSASQQKWQQHEQHPYYPTLRRTRAEQPR
ncbi:hypothetical protein PUNSTDRAFT_119807, partial [Punctularia strigosozonata HHB-11173 SS5]|uniref:uncharacterized protein n=1 Tax=Punctularia strigosozonata (strain HHB-11173) TaxID=741275 RepID=UPI00044175A1